MSIWRGWRSSEACLEVIPLVQRGLGLNSFYPRYRIPYPNMMGDLATYLRQPAADKILTQAAVHFTEIHHADAFWV